MVRTTAPPVSVGLPVRNGMPYLVEALQALLQQSFGDFELVVCDNASTDETEEVTRDFVRADPRVRYVRVETDEGASANFNRCVLETRAPLFTWAASDDRFLPDYLRRCVTYLEAHSEYVMCVPGVRFIDETGMRRGELRQPPSLASPEVSARLRTYLDRRSWYMIYGLMRREALTRTGMLAQCFGPDVILLWEILLRFRIGTLEEALIEYRRYRVKEAEAVWRGIQPESSGATPGWLHISLFRGLLECLNREDLDAGTRATGRLILLRWLASTPFRDLVVDDLRDELRRSGRRPNPFYDAALMAAMALLRPTRGLRLARRESIVTVLRQHTDRDSSRSPRPGDRL